MPKAFHTTLCLLIAAAWLSHGSAMVAHSHDVGSLPTNSAAFDATQGPCAPEHGSGEVATPCAVCAQHASTAGREARPAAVDVERSLEPLPLGSERSDLPFESVLGDAQSPRPPPILAARV